MGSCHKLTWARAVSETTEDQPPRAVSSIASVETKVCPATVTRDPSSPCRFSTAGSVAKNKISYSVRTRS